jgi:hypothetical protein
MSNPLIGMILGTEDATPLQFWFAVNAKTKVQLDDIVYIAVPDPTQNGEAALKECNLTETQNSSCKVSCLPVSPTPRTCS